MAEQKIGSYLLVSRLGSGGTGTVFKAYQETLKRTVALKVLHPMYAGDEALLKRFKREIEISSDLTHPNLVRVYDAGVDEDKWYFSMEFVEGEPLRSRIKKEKNLPVADAIDIARQTLEPMVYFHPKGLIHRDIKPENILLRKDGRVKLMDFGIVKATEKTILTRVGSTLGTPRYMAPEMVTGEPQDLTADIWQFAVVFYEILCGRCPFDGATLSEIAYRITDLDPLPPSQANEELGQAFDGMILKCLKKEPKDRFQSAAEVIEALDAAETAFKMGRVPARSPRNRRSSSAASASGVSGSSATPTSVAAVESSSSGISGLSAPEVTVWIKDSVKSLRIEMDRQPALKAVLAFGLFGTICAGLLVHKLMQPTFEAIGQVEVVAGSTGFLVRWRTGAPSPTEVEVVDSATPTRSPRVFKNEEQPSSTEHSVVIRNMSPGSDYLVKLVYPGDGRSSGIPVSIPHDAKLVTTSPQVETNEKGESVLVIRTGLPALSRVRFERESQERDQVVSSEYVQEHALNFGVIGPDDVLKNIRMTLTGVDQTEELRVGSVFGERRLLQGLHVSLGTLSKSDRASLNNDIDRLLFKTFRSDKKTHEEKEEAYRDAQKTARRFIRDHGLEDLLSGLKLRAHALANSRSRVPHLANLLDMIQRLEDFDYVGYWSDARRPILGIYENYTPILEISYPPKEAEHGRIIRTYENDPSYNFITRQWKEENPNNFSRDGAYYIPTVGMADMTGIISKFRDGDAFEFEVAPGELAGKEFAQLTIFITSMKPEGIVRLALNSELMLYFRQRTTYEYSYSGMFYNDYKTSMQYANPIRMNFPSRFLTTGKNEASVRAESAAGVPAAIGATILQVWFKLIDSGAK